MLDHELTASPLPLHPYAIRNRSDPLGRATLSSSSHRGPAVAHTHRCCRLGYPQARPGRRRSMGMAGYVRRDWKLRLEFPTMEPTSPISCGNNVWTSNCPLACGRGEGSQGEEGRSQGHYRMGSGCSTVSALSHLKANEQGRHNCDLGLSWKCNVLGSYDDGAATVVPRSQG